MCSLPGCLSCPVGTYSLACCCSVRFGWGWLLTEVAEGEGLGGIQMVWLCKSIFLLNKIRFCSASNLFSCIRLLHVCARTMAGFPPAFPSPSPCAALSGGNWPDPCVHLCPPVICTDCLLGHLFCISLFSSQGEEYLQLLSTVFGQKHSVFVSLDFCSTAGTIKVMQVTPGTACDGLLLLSTSYRYCLNTAASIQIGIKERLGCKRRWQKYPGHSRSIANFKLLVNVFL